MILPLLQLLSPASASTDITVPFTGQRSHTFDLHAGFGVYGRSVAVGGRYAIPIVQNGFVPSINNAVYITFGADLYTAVYRAPNGDFYRGAGLGIPLTLAWNFYFTDEWSAFGEAGINGYIGEGFFRGYGFEPGAAWIATAAGGRYHMNEKMALILRVGFPYSSFGVEFTL